jgi:hypothetical protein
MLLILEKFQQQLAWQYVQQRPEAIQAAMDSLGEFSQAKDVLDVPEFKGLYDTILRSGNQMANRLGRSLQIGGNADTSPGARMMGRQATDVQSQLLGGLAPYAQNLMNLRYQAPLAAAELETGDITQRMNVAGQVGFLPRALQDLRNASKWNMQQQKALFDYQVRAPIFASIAGSNLPTVVSGGGPSMFQQASPIIGSVLGNMLSSPGGLGGGLSGLFGGGAPGVDAASLGYGAMNSPFTAGAGATGGAMGGGGLGGLLSGIGGGIMGGLGGLGSMGMGALSGVGSLGAGALGGLGAMGGGIMSGLGGLLAMI